MSSKTDARRSASRKAGVSSLPQVVALDEALALFDNPDWYRIASEASAADSSHTDVAIYVRISKDRPNETSTKTQEDEAREYCKAQGWTVADVFTDIGKSAFDTSVKRTGLNAAMAFLKAGKANRLLVWKLDRFMRNTNEFMRYHAKIREAGAVFASVKEPWFDTATPFGMANVVLMSALAQMEAENIRMRVAPSWKRRHEQRLTPVGVAPFGYRRTGKNVLEVDEAEAEALRDVVAKFLAGATLRGLAKELNEAGHTTAAGNAFTHIGITRALRTPTIAALHELPDGTLLASDKWPAIIDSETYMAIRERMADPSRRAHLEGVSCASKWMLSGVLRCGRCEDARFKTKPHAEGRRYQCRECGNSIAAQMADDFVTAGLFDAIDQDAWEAMRSQGRKADPAATERMQAKYDRERAKYFADQISEDEWDRFQADYRAHVETLEEAEAIDIPDVDDIRQAWPTLDASSQKMVLNAAFERIVIYPVARGRSGAGRIEMRIAS